MHTRYFLQTIEIKDHDVMIDGSKFFDPPVKNDIRRNEKMKKIATGHT